jgi:hypothetical protein
MSSSKKEVQEHVVFTTMTSNISQRILSNLAGFLPKGKGPRYIVGGVNLMTNDFFVSGDIEQHANTWAYNTQTHELITFPTWKLSERELGKRNKVNNTLRQIATILTNNGFPVDPKKAHTAFDRLNIGFQNASPTCMAWSRLLLTWTLRQIAHSPGMSLYQASLCVQRVVDQEASKHVRPDSPLLEDTKKFYPDFDTKNEKKQMMLLKSVMVERFVRPYMCAAGSQILHECGQPGTPEEALQLTRNLFMMHSSDGFIRQMALASFEEMDLYKDNYDKMCQISSERCTSIVEWYLSARNLRTACKVELLSPEESGSEPDAPPH